MTVNIYTPAVDARNRTLHSISDLSLFKMVSVPGSNRFHKQFKEKLQGTTLSSYLKLWFVV